MLRIAFGSLLNCLSSRYDLIIYVSRERVDQSLHLLDIRNGFVPLFRTLLEGFAAFF